MQPDHPSKDIIGSDSNELEGKTICVCVTGSVAISNTPALCRQLMRKGAEIYCVMSAAAMELIHPNLLHWATGNPVITELTGEIEHIVLAGERLGKMGKADIVMVSPATANTISKIACGIDDTPVTTVVTTAFGSRTPIIIVPAMHESMYNHPIVQDNIQKLQELGVNIIRPRVEESKAKIALIDEIVGSIVQKLTNQGDLQGKSFLITAGPCREYLDPIRFLSNPSTGRMGIELAREIKSRNGDVVLILGKTYLNPPLDIKTIRVETSDDYLNAIKTELKTKSFDVFISSAAISDFKPETIQSDKIKSANGEMSVKFIPTPKIIQKIREFNKKMLIVAFKAESNITKDELINRAHARLLDSNADLIVANDVGKGKRGFETPTNEIYIIDKKKKVIHVPLSTKKKCSEEIITQIKNLFK